VILYGEPGTGKTLLAKAVANQTSASFLRVVGSELIQKYLGDGPKLVRELFRVADEVSRHLRLNGLMSSECVVVASA
jgi:26S proteasome regulatory subunit T2